MNLNSPRHRSSNLSLAFNRRANARPLCAVLVIVAAPLVAQAQSTPPREGFSATLGLGVVSSSSYEGSPHRRTLIGPDVSMSYRTPALGTFDLGPQGLTWAAPGDDELRWGLVITSDPGRLERRPGRLNPTPGDSRLAGMGNIDSSVEAGAFVGFGPLTVTARRSVGDKAHAASRVDIGLRHGVALSDRIGVQLEAAAAWAGRGFMQSHFGVTSAQSVASGFHLYSPGAGWHRTTLSVAAEYRLATPWSARVSIAGTRLGDAAADSPIVARRSFSTVAVSVVRAY
ncbi:MAG TPA: MipA/OmpV family protein [Piscinibacter sp.]|nr:MipA/OmpV family protein [Piscinibacter sp.]HPM68304.1 MipA/OmpV family protein [Piscinibacter sp.]